MQVLIKLHIQIANTLWLGTVYKGQWHILEEKDAQDKEESDFQEELIASSRTKEENRLVKGYPNYRSQVYSDFCSPSQWPNHAQDLISFLLLL